MACSSKKLAPSTHYSPLTQIDTANVQDLQVAWTYHTGDADTLNHSQIQCNPLVVDGSLYGTSPRLVLFALDAATGMAKWTFNPQDSNQNKSRKDFALNNNRGVAYWKGGDDRRIFYSAGPWLYAIDANTGKLIPSFGKDGKIDLHDAKQTSAQQSRADEQHNRQGNLRRQKQSSHGRRCSAFVLAAAALLQGFADGNTSGSNRRQNAEYDAGGERNAYRENQDSPVRMNLVDAGEV